MSSVSSCPKDYIVGQRDPDLGLFAAFHILPHSISAEWIVELGTGELLWSMGSLDTSSRLFGRNHKILAWSNRWTWFRLESKWLWHQVDQDCVCRMVWLAMWRWSWASILSFGVITMSVMMILAGLVVPLGIANRISIHSGSRASTAQVTTCYFTI